MTQDYDREIEFYKPPRLKYCPFCGGRAIYDVDSFSSTNECDDKYTECKFTIRCSKCQIRLPKWYVQDLAITDDGVLTSTINKLDDAADDWNTRTNMEV